MTSEKDKISLFWYRRDLRLEDNAGLYHALKGGVPVLPVFIFDTDILDKLPEKADARVQFIYETVEGLKKQLHGLGSDLLVKHGQPLHIWKELAEHYDIQAVYTNHDYEPDAIKRDAAIASFLKSKDIAFYTCKDQVIFEKDEVVKADGLPYTVYTPFSKKWKEKLNDFYLKAYPDKNYYSNFYKTETSPFIQLESLGFSPSAIKIPVLNIDTDIIKHYQQTRDFPAQQHGTTRLGLHLRFGTISVRKLASVAKSLNETYLNELIWREFFMTILYYFPHVVNGAFHKAFDNIKWENSEAQFKKWCEGKTGFPMVDAGMRELNATGFMHNRVRMVTASFLAKNLLIDWRWGEQYFADKLLDFELSANNGNWQWAAGTGCDAAPYFRIFNPIAQMERFDKAGAYIRKWVPEFGSPSYPAPMIDFKFSRERALKAYKEALGR